jgi:hypothetical protein
LRLLAILEEAFLYLLSDIPTLYPMLRVFK